MLLASGADLKALMFQMGPCRPGSRGGAAKYRRQIYFSVTFSRKAVSKAAFCSPVASVWYSARQLS